MRAELAQLRAEKTTWQASLEQAGREKRFYMENCEQLRKEVVQLQVQKERIYTEQIAGLEKQVADLSRKLINLAEVAEDSSKISRVAVVGDLARDVETQTPQAAPNTRLVTSSIPTEEMEGLARLEENLAMVLRTGVYGETDHVVMQLTEQIRNIP